MHLSMNPFSSSSSTSNLHIEISPHKSINNAAYHGHMGDDYEQSIEQRAYPLKRLDCLGKGSSSVVFRAIHLKNLTVCAEKVIVSIDPTKQILLIRELESLKKTVHDSTCLNIVQLLDVVPNPIDGTISICLEYMNGGSLQDIVEAGGCSDENVLRRIARQMLTGLKHLHDLRVIHRDLKPSNALISSKGVVKLADFGLARTLDIGNTLADSFVGTFDYMAPERMTGQQYSFLSDVWALGLTIHTTALGHYPYRFTGKGYWAILNAIQELPVPLPSSTKFSKEFIAFIQKSCEKDPAKRSTAKGLLNDSFVLGVADNVDDDIDDANSATVATPRRNIEDLIAEAHSATIDVTKFATANKRNKIPGERKAMQQKKLLQATKKGGSSLSNNNTDDDGINSDVNDDGSNTGEKLKVKKKRPSSRQNDDSSSSLSNHNNDGPTTTSDNTSSNCNCTSALPYKTYKVSLKLPTKSRSIFIEENRKLLRPQAPESLHARPTQQNKLKSNAPTPHATPIDITTAAPEGVKNNATLGANPIVQQFNKYIDSDSKYHKSLQRVSSLTASDAFDIANVWKQYVIKKIVHENSQDNIDSLTALMPNINLSIESINRLGRELGCSQTLLRTSFHRAVVEIKEAVMLAVGLGGTQLAELGEEKHVSATKVLKNLIRVDERSDRLKQLEGSSSDDDDDDDVDGGGYDYEDNLGIGRVDDDDAYDDDFEQDDDGDSDDDYR